MNITLDNGLYDRIGRTYHMLMGHGEQTEEEAESPGELRSAIFVKGLFWDGDYRH